MKSSVLVASLLVALCASPVMAERPNVLFSAVDDLNDWVACFGGNPQVKTPNFDRFHAQGGMVMFNAHAPSTVCCPSRSALLTGVHCHKTGVYGNANNLKNAPKAKNLVTLPEYFSQHGYVSLSMGKIFHRHKVPGQDEVDAGQWAFDEWYKTLTTYGRGNHRIYDGRYSYITYRGGEELYGHQDGPMEWTNLARHSEYAEIKARLKACLPTTNEP